ncbi:hypothetical protein [Rhizobium cremeum]|uniref:hypothetical protein n=1 Tax=Rhizobium cremeum TaxID=2813827 RepID=UPI000DDC2F5A
MRNHMLFIATSVTLAGCTAVTKPPSPPTLESIHPPGYATVAPTSGIEVGHLYFSGKGKRPKFMTADGTVYNALCYDDFLKTGALKDLEAQVVVEDKVRVDKKTENASRTSSAGLSIDKLAKLGVISADASAKGSRIYTMENVRELTLTEAGAKLVMEKIGGECRAVIAERKAAGSNVILVLNAWRADKLTDVTNQYLGGSAGLSVGGTITSSDGKTKVIGNGGGFGGEGRRDGTTEYSYVVVSINPDKL